MKKIKSILFLFISIVVLSMGCITTYAQNYGNGFTNGTLSNIKAVGDMAWNNQKDVQKVLPNSVGHGVTFQQYNNKAAYCTKFHELRPAGTDATCTINLDEWGNDKKIQIGVAAIIMAADANNSSMSNEYYYAELAINHFLYLYNVDENGKPRSEKNNIVGDVKDSRLVSAVLGDYKYLEAAEAAIEKYTNGLKVNNIKQTSGTTIWNLNVDDTTTLSNSYEVSGENIESYSIRTHISGHPSQNVIVKVNGNVTYENGNETVLDNQVLDSNNKGTFTVTVEGLQDNENFKVTVGVTGKNSYYIANNYKCTLNGKDYQSLTLNEVEKQTQGLTKSASFIVKTHTTPTPPPEITYPNLKIQKVDSSNNPLKGAEFTLYEKINDTLTEIETFEDDEKSEYDYESINEGEYCVKETKSPSGYYLNSHEYCFTVNKDNENNITATTTNENINISADNSLITVTVSDELNLVRIFKVNEQGKFIANTKLRIVRFDGKEFTIKEGDGELQTVRDYVFTTLENVENKFYGLPVGVYRVYENEAPAGYIKSDDYRTFVVTKDMTKKINVAFSNKPISISISKIDIANSKELPGASLRILKEDNETVAEDILGNKLAWTSDDKPHTITKIPAGTYYLEETQAPSGYKLMTEKMKFTIDAYGRVTVSEETQNDTVLIMSNAVTKVTISKQDITTKEELPGATLRLLDENGEIVVLNGEKLEWVSTNEPHIIEGLPAGTYTLTEITSPDGYSLNEESITFTINADGSITGDTIMYNTPITEVPPTFSTGSFIITSFGVLILIVGVGIYIYGIKKQKQI